MREIPSLSKINDASPNYISELDNGLREIKALYRLQSEAYRNLFDQQYSRIFARVKGIEGIVIEEVPEKISSETIGGEIINSSSYKAIKVTSENIKLSRNVEDLLTNEERKCEGEFRQVNDYFTNLRRTYEDFTEAIMAKTEIFPLNETNFKLDGLHTYLLRGNEVYEAHVNLKIRSEISPFVNKNLKSSDFENSEILDKFKKQSEGINGNVFLVKNPSSEIEIEKLCWQSINHYRGMLEHHMAEIDKKETSDPVESMLGGIKRAWKNWFP